VRRERYGDIGKPDAGAHVPVGIDRRHADHERLADLRRLHADDPFRPVRPEIQMKRAQRLLRQRAGTAGHPAIGRRQRPPAIRGYARSAAAPFLGTQRSSARKSARTADE
jgi:hypothetical protein